MYEKGQRFKIINPESDEHNMMFTILGVEFPYVFFSFDGEKTVRMFKVGSEFESYITELF